MTPFLDRFGVSYSHLISGQIFSEHAFFNLPHKADMFIWINVLFRRLLDRAAKIDTLVPAVQGSDLREKVIIFYIFLYISGGNLRFHLVMARGSKIYSTALGSLLTNKRATRIGLAPILLLSSCLVYFDIEFPYLK